MRPLAGAEGKATVGLPAMLRALALRIEADMAENWTIIQRLRMTLQIALLLLLLNIATWMLAIGWAGPGPSSRKAFS